MTDVRTPTRDRRSDPVLGKLPNDDAAVLPALRGRSGRLLVVLALLTVVLAGAVLLVTWRLVRAPPERGAASPSPPAVSAPAASPVAPPSARPDAPPPLVAATPAPPPQPPLAESDALLRAALARLFGADRANAVLHSDHLAQRLVATADNLPRSPVSLRLSPVKPVAGPFRVERSGDGLVVAPDNAARYEPYVSMLEAVDAKTAIAAYGSVYPLLQQAYRQLGYPDGAFDARLIEVIDDLLAAPDLAAAPALVQPKVLYRYADPELEARSSGQKIMMRMGPANDARVKTKLRELRRELAGRLRSP